MEQLQAYLESPLFWATVIITAVAGQAAAKALAWMATRAGTKLGRWIVARSRKRAEWTRAATTAIEANPHAEIMLAFDEQRSYRRALFYMVVSFVALAIGVDQHGVVRVFLFALTGFAVFVAFSNLNHHYWAQWLLRDRTMGLLSGGRPEESPPPSGA